MLSEGPLPTPLTIAIDGPVASGKNTVGLRLAQRLGCSLLDTGAMYRALTWAALQAGADFDDNAALAELAERTTMTVEPATAEQPNGALLLDGEDVTDRLRLPEVERNVSRLSSVPEVRRLMVEEQRRIGAAGGVVMIGRDIGTVVLPDCPEIGRAHV